MLQMDVHVLEKVNDMVFPYLVAMMNSRGSDGLEATSEDMLGELRELLRRQNARPRVCYL